MSAWPMDRLYSRGQATMDGLHDEVIHGAATTADALRQPPKPVSLGFRV